jgi:hypothetical protein
MGFRINHFCYILTILLHNQHGGGVLIFGYLLGTDYDFMKSLPQ